MVIIGLPRVAELLHSVKDIRRHTLCAEDADAWVIISKTASAPPAGTLLLAPANTDGRPKFNNARELELAAWDTSKLFLESSRTRLKVSLNEHDSIKYLNWKFINIITSSFKNCILIPKAARSHPPALLTAFTVRTGCHACTSRICGNSWSPYSLARSNDTRNPGRSMSAGLWSSGTHIAPAIWWNFCSLSAFGMYGLNWWGLSQSPSNLLKAGTVWWLLSGSPELLCIFSVCN